jgi:hypothetical protein
MVPSPRTTPSHQSQALADYGLFDMGGNVPLWRQDGCGLKKLFRVARGPSQSPAGMLWIVSYDGSLSAATLLNSLNTFLTFSPCSVWREIQVTRRAEILVAEVSFLDWIDGGPPAALLVRRPEE